MVGGSRWRSREEESANASFLHRVPVDPADYVVDEDSALQGEVGVCPWPVQLHQRHVEDRLRLGPAGHLPHAADRHRPLVFLQTSLIIVTFPFHSVTQHESVENKQNQLRRSGKEDLTRSESIWSDYFQVPENIQQIKIYLLQNKHDFSFVASSGSEEDKTDCERKQYVA